MDVRTHKIATCAYRCVEARLHASNRKKYGALAHRLPGMILQNGLAQATGFLVAKTKREDDEHAALLADLNTVLKQTDTGATSTETGRELHEAIIDSDMMEALNLTRRALVVSGWLKRYAQGVLRVDPTGGDAQSGTLDESGGGLDEADVEGTDESEHKEVPTA